jgi:hypothetical protein
VRSGGWGTPSGAFSGAGSSRLHRRPSGPGARPRLSARNTAPPPGSTARTTRRIAPTEARITCPLLALWSAHGPLDQWYADAGGPLALWHEWAGDARGHPVEGGHFFPEEAPEHTAEMLSAFFAA